MIESVGRVATVAARLVRSVVACAAVLVSLPSAAAGALSDLAVLEDPQGVLSIEDVSGRRKTDFQPLPYGSFAGGFTRSTFWLRFTISGAGEHWLDVLPPVLDDLRLYVPDSADPDKFSERIIGAGHPFNLRELDYRGFAFRLQHPDPAPRVYFVRLQTNSSAVFTPRVWSAEKFFERVSLETAVLLASLGIIALVIVLNILTWFWVRDALTPWFVLYLALLAAHFASISGFLQQYLVPDFPEANYYIRGTVSLLLLASGSAFYRHYFLADGKRSGLVYVYDFNVAVALLCLIPAWVGYFTEVAPVVNAMAALMTIVGIVLSLDFWRRQVLGGAMMLVANLVSLASILVFILNVLGVIAGGFAVWHSLQVASLGSILALQIAVGAHYRRMQEEREKADRVAETERTLRKRQADFLSMLTHELRTSLSVLRMALGTQPMSATAIDRAQRAIEGMNGVIDRSLQAEAISDQATRASLQPCDVAQILEGVVLECREPDRVQVSVETRPTLTTDGQLLRVIASNLIENALKYGKAGETVQVSLSGDHPVRVRVENQVGLAGRPDPGKVFEKHYRAPMAHERTGSGLGLYIAREMTRLLGGRLEYRGGDDRVVFELEL